MNSLTDGIKKNGLLLVLLFLASCTKTQLQTPEVILPSYVFEDGFEIDNGDWMELFPEDGSRWTNIQQVNPQNGDNEFGVSSTMVLEGSNSFRILAKPSDDVLSKMDIEKAGLYAPEGSTITLEAQYYIASTANIENLLLMDVESCSCWDPSVANNQCPGVRLMMKSNDYLSIERGKILGSVWEQSVVPFPRNEWVKVKWEMTLSSDPESGGVNRLYINDQLVLSESGMNMPNSELFTEAFAVNDVDFELQQPLIYDRVQIGATANPTATEVEMYVDQVKIVIAY